MIPGEFRPWAKEFVDKVFDVVDHPRPGTKIEEVTVFDRKQIQEERHRRRLAAGSRPVRFNDFRVQRHKAVRLNPEGRAVFAARRKLDGKSRLELPEEIDAIQVDLPTSDPNIIVVASRGVLRCVNLEIAHVGTANVSELFDDGIDGELLRAMEADLAGQRVNFPSTPRDLEIMATVLSSVGASPFSLN